jgi:hypothetical protein
MVWTCRFKNYQRCIYREYVYEVGAIDAGKGAVIDEEIGQVLFACP